MGSVKRMLPTLLFVLVVALGLVVGLLPTRTFAAAHNVATFADLQNAITADTDPTINITVTASFDFTALLNIPSNKTVTITSATPGSPQTLTRDPAYQNNLFSIPVNAELTISNLIVDGNKANAVASSALVINYGSFVLNAGAVLQNNNNSSSGGGIFNGETGTTTINGGEILGNVANRGGGIANTCAGAIIIHSGNIEGNTAGEGGGIYNALLPRSGSNCTINMDGGTIQNNTATYEGGGVYNGADGELTMTGGSMTGNTAGERGGGIYFDDDAVSVTLGGDAEIGDSLGSGNGIFLDTEKVILIESGYNGFANLEDATDVYLGRPVVEGAPGSTAQISDIAEFAWMPTGYILKFNGGTDQIVLGLNEETPPIIAPPNTGF